MNNTKDAMTSFGIDFDRITSVMEQAEDFMKEYIALYHLNADSDIHSLAKEQYNCFRTYCDTITELCEESYAGALEMETNYNMRNNNVHPDCNFYFTYIRGKLNFRLDNGEDKTFWIDYEQGTLAGHIKAFEKGI